MTFSQSSTRMDLRRSGRRMRTVGRVWKVSSWIEVLVCVVTVRTGLTLSLSNSRPFFLDNPRISSPFFPYAALPLPPPPLPPLLLPAPAAAFSPRSRPLFLRLFVVEVEDLLVVVARIDSSSSFLRFAASSLFSSLSLRRRSCGTQSSQL